MLNKINSLIRNKNFQKILSVLVILALLVTPYIIFGTSMHIEGDDSHLYYDYPTLYINHIASSSWTSYSSFGKEDEQYFFLPILYIFKLIVSFGIPSFVIQNSCFSLIFILGFIYFRKCLAQLVDSENNYTFEIFAASLVYIFSPIILYSPVKHYLAAVWLVGVVPLLGYLFIKYVKTAAFKYVACAAISSIIFAFAINAIPWLLGFIISAFAGLLVNYIVTKNKMNLKILLRSSIWFLVVLLGQLFWFLPFARSFLGGGTLGNNLITSQTASSFGSTVIATDQGNNIIYPLLNLFHKSFLANFDLNVYASYRNWYFYLIPLSSIYAVVIFWGLLSRKWLNFKFYIPLVSSFVVALFLFTVKIGFFEHLFILLGSFPGFVMFRNFYDKFAFGYALIFSLLVGLSLMLITVQQQHRKWLGTAMATLVVIAALLNAKPFFTGQIINTPLQSTQNIKANIQIPNEYTAFMTKVGNVLPQDSNIFDIPFGTSSYTVIKGKNTNNVYSGKSPVKLFSGINDFSGDISFTPSISDQVDTYIQNRDYKKLKNILNIMHINYFLVTNNIPSEMLNTSLFNNQILKNTGSDFRANMFGKLILKSSSANYELYSLAGSDQTNSNASVNSIKSLYQVSPKLLEKSGQLISDNLANFLNSQKAAVSTQAGNIGANHSLTSYSIGQQVNSNASVYVPYNDFYSVSYDNQNGTLGLQNIAAANYGGNTTQTALFNIGDVQRSDIIKIKNAFYNQSNISNAVVENNDNFVLYRPAQNSLTDTNFSSSNTIFRPGDCNAYNKNKDTSYSFTNSSATLSLSAKNNHNSCMYFDVPTINGGVYSLSYNYTTNLAGSGITVQQGSDTKTPYEPSINEGQNIFDYTFTATSSSSRIYIYSGKSNKTATTTFSNLKFTQYNPVQSTKFIDSQSNSNANLYKATSIAKNTVSSPVAIAPLSNWNKGDCAAVDQTPSTSFRTINSNQITLNASRGHNACIYNSLPVDSNYSYTLSFDYYSKNLSSPFTLAYGNTPGYPLKTYAGLSTNNKWIHLSLNLPSPVRANGIILYLYSGKNDDGTSETTYKNLAIRSMAKTYSDNLAVTSLSSKLGGANVKSTEIAPYKYKINIATKSQNILLNLSQPYHTGWSLSTTNGRLQGGVKHILINNLDNGWYIDIAQICNQSADVCTKHNGTYDLKLVAEFTPQRYFYAGLIVSGATLVGCVTYLGYSFVRRRRQAAEEGVYHDTTIGSKRLSMAQLKREMKLPALRKRARRR